MASKLISFRDRFLPRLTKQVLIGMFKGAIPPTLGLVIYQSSYFIAREFSSYGYVVCIIAILGGANQPRVPFVKTMIVSIILTILGFCISLLAGYCITQARLHTTPANGNLNDYNSSAAAVAGIWVIFDIWMAHTFRAYRLQFTPCVIVHTIFTEISIVQLSSMPDMASVIEFELSFLQVFLIGEALATVVALFVLPVSSRKVAFSDVRKFLAASQKTLKAEAAYVASFENSKILDDPRKQSNSDTGDTIDSKEDLYFKPKHVMHNQQSKDLTAAVASFTGIARKMRADMAVAKKDIGWGVLTADDLSTLVGLLRELTLPLRGVSVLMNIFARLCEWRGWVVFEDTAYEGSPLGAFEKNPDIEQDVKERLQWAAILRSFRSPIDRLTLDMQDGLQHTSIVLGFEKQAKKSETDEESRTSPGPGESDFTQYLEGKKRAFDEERVQALSEWMVASGTDLKETFAENHVGRNNQEQLFVLLYMQHLFHGIFEAILDLVRFADAHNVHERSARIIFPGRRRLVKTVEQFFKEQDTADDMNANDTRVAPVHVVMMGTGSHPDPDHLPPENKFQILGNRLRRVPHFLSSPQSLFGFRCACAVMTVAIVAFLRQSQNFFFDQRGQWAMIIIAFCMTPNSGQSLMGFVYRLIGTVAAAATAIVLWYIGGGSSGNPTGVLIFMYINYFFWYYFIITMPQYVGVWKVIIITQSIIIGYSLQTQKTGVEAPPATDSNHYPIYLIAPYRLAATAVGVTAAFFWTVFPSAVTSRSVVRQQLGQSLMLLASYYSCMHTVIQMWASDTYGDTNDKKSPGRQLEKTRGQIFAKELTLISSVRQHSELTKFEPSIGGPFPKTLYDKIVNEIDIILSHMNLVTYAISNKSTTTSVPNSPFPAIEKSWLRSLSKLFGSADFSSHNISALLTVFSAAVMNGQPLPPFITPPRPYALARQIQNMDPELLSPKHALDPGYSAYAVIEVSYSMIAESLGRLHGLVRELMGEVEFGFQKKKLGSGKEGEKVD
ncbi:hypothetical protein K402DRAFT_419123 [Aulographum hederae CBS 113979]|uniref:ER transporter 6TM N-terminal domain-containing protein n=1 Tax=Aulographum hederae CBS 113979 TaxID=1176131 RepID=A0A6G1H6C3_9PEZI|nr:hypothetical protein K402DRAFT_419123 [Aulographum hederae CBS 113979]